MVTLPPGVRVLVGVVATVWLVPPALMAIVGMQYGVPPLEAIRRGVTDNLPVLLRLTCWAGAFTAVAYVLAAVWWWVVGP